MKRLLIVFSLVAHLARGVSFAGDYEDGWAAFQRGDTQAALASWKKAANQGHAIAQNLVGVMYKKGQGVPQNYNQAVFWYRKAAEQGNGEAQYNLGVAYVRGQGVPQDYKQAVYWYRKAAEQGLDRAQNNLGFMYANGRGVPRDYVEAHKWYEIAAAYANHDEAREAATKNKDSIAERMTRAQIAEAKKRASEWTARKN